MDRLQTEDGHHFVRVRAVWVIAKTNLPLVADEEPHSSSPKSMADVFCSPLRNSSANMKRLLPTVCKCLFTDGRHPWLQNQQTLPP